MRACRSNFSMSVSGASASHAARGMPLHCADVPEHCGMLCFPGLRPPMMATAKNRPLHLYEAPGEWPQTTPPPPEPPSTRPLMSTCFYPMGDKGCRPAGAWGSRGYGLALLGCSTPLPGGGRHCKMTGTSGYSQSGTRWLTQPPNHPSKANRAFSVQGVPSTHPASLHQVGVPAWDWVHRTSRSPSTQCSGSKVST